VPERVEHDHLLHDDVCPHEPRASRLAAVRDELRHRPACVCDDDLLSSSNASQELREEVASVAGVVLGEVAWRGVAMWRGLAKPPEKSTEHA
jgi:hypothetical protein